MKKALWLKTTRTLLLPVGMSVLVLSLSGCDVLNALPWFQPSQQEAPATTTPTTGTTPDAAVLQPGQADAYKALLDAGHSKAQQGDWSGAIADFKQILERNPNYAAAHVQLGWAYAEQKQWDDAQFHLLSAIRQEPDNAGAHANLAWVYAEKKRWHDAQTSAKRAIDLDPANPYAHATLAWAYQESGEPDLAMAEYEKSLELKPDLDNSHFALGVAWCNKGQLDRAKRHHQKLVELGSGHAGALQTRMAKGCGHPRPD